MRAREDFLLDLLMRNDATFFIPPYQRSYSWDKEQCMVLWNDIISTTKTLMAGEPAGHFFGMIVYVSEEQVFGETTRLILTDGQQRITTVMLFLAALRDSLDGEQSKKVEDQFLINHNASGNDVKYKVKLKQVENDWNTFVKIVLKDSNIDDKECRIYKNYKLFCGLIEKTKKSSPDLFKKLAEGLSKFSVVTVQLEPVRNKWENPQEVFESMNSLGKPLSLADLVRNYLLMGRDGNEQERLYNTYWVDIEKRLGDDVSNYIRDYMQLVGARDYKKATPTNYKELYLQFKQLFTDRGVDAERLLQELQEFSKYYSYIVVGTGSGDQNVDTLLAYLRQIDATTIYSLLLKIVGEWKRGIISDISAKNMIYALFVYMLRRRIVRITQGENKRLPSLASMIDDIGQDSDPRRRMFEVLANQDYSLRLPNDAEVIGSLRSMNAYSFKYIKFLFALVENSNTRSMPNIKDKRLQIEHIMPQTLTNEWKDMLGPDWQETHQELVNNIGNLTLVYYNQELGNKPFDQKLAIYNSTSGMWITRCQITDNTDWRRSEIEKRSEWLSDYITTKVLPLPDDMRKSDNYSSLRRTARYRWKLSFDKLDLVGKTINYIPDQSISAVVVDNKKVLFEGGYWKLSPLTRELKRREGDLNTSGAYQGSKYWQYNGVSLADMMDELVGSSSEENDGDED